jgi:S-adenosyl-L-methionine hydrolase (adenosine-forming)
MRPLPAILRSIRTRTYGGVLATAGRVLERERTFSDRPPGAAFWYENSNGLAEIAVNQGRADRDLGLAIGIPVEVVS